jgi:hypothetical protein
MNSVPTKVSSTTMGRKTTCNGCGYSQWTITSYYLDRKAWKTTHTREFCKSQKAFNEFYADLMAM